MDSKAKFELRRLDAGEIPVALHTRLPLAMLYEYRCLSSPSLFSPSSYNRDFYIMELPSTELQYADIRTRSATANLPLQNGISAAGEPFAHG